MLSLSALVNDTHTFILVQDAQKMFSKQEDRLYSTFQTCLDNSEVFSNETLPPNVFSVLKSSIQRC